MKPIVRGSSVYLREVVSDDSSFILALRTDSKKNGHISATPNDPNEQERFLSRYFESTTDFYFIICDWQHKRLGTVRIYDAHTDSFRWGSWLIRNDAPAHVAIESALLIYEFAFFSLHYRLAKFEVQRGNNSVVRFHERFGVRKVSSDPENFYYELDVQSYIRIRERFLRFLIPEAAAGGSGKNLS